MTPIVTSCDESFLPGLVALHNSYLQNSREGFTFHALLTGTREFADHVRHDLGIDAILNPPFPCDDYPTSSYYPEPRAVMWTSLLTPDLFDAPRSIHIDTDSIILRNLQPLVNAAMGDRVMAATRCNAPRERNYIPKGGDYKGCYEGRGPMTSLMIFNREPWQRKRMLARVVEAMQRRDIEWTMIGQGVLHYVIRDDWQELPWHHQAHAGHDTFFTAPKDEIYTLHFMGTKPWREFKHKHFVTPQKLQTRALWRTYAGQAD